MNSLAVNKVISCHVRMWSLCFRRKMAPSSSSQSLNMLTVDQIFILKDRFMRETRFKRDFIKL